MTIYKLTQQQPHGVFATTGSTRKWLTYWSKIAQKQLENFGWAYSVEVIPDGQGLENTGTTSSHTSSDAHSTTSKEDHEQNVSFKVVEQSLEIAVNDLGYSGPDGTQYTVTLRDIAKAVKLGIEYGRTIDQRVADDLAGEEE